MFILHDPCVCAALQKYCDAMEELGRTESLLAPLTVQGSTDSPEYAALDQRRETEDAITLERYRELDTALECWVTQRFSKTSQAPPRPSSLLRAQHA